MGCLQNKSDIWVLIRQTVEIIPVHYPLFGNYGQFYMDFKRIFV